MGVLVGLGCGRRTGGEGTLDHVKFANFFLGRFVLELQIVKLCLQVPLEVLGVVHGILSQVSAGAHKALNSAEFRLHFLYLGLQKILLFLQGVVLLLKVHDAVLAVER